MTAERLPARGAARAPRSALVRRTALAGLAVLFAGFLALGTWQVERRAWKLDLIERVERRARAEPVAAPEPAPPAERLHADWEYRRVSVTGRYLAGADTLVQAVTDLGPGFWVLTPLQRPGGESVLVNRGFVATRSTAPVRETARTVTGLLRLSEPGGGFLRRNDPAAGRWFSRDVGAIAAARGLVRAAPYFIDADAAGAATVKPDEPVGGLTVVRFANNHLVYALTWYTLAVLCAAAAVPLLREERRFGGRPPAGAGR